MTYFIDLRADSNGGNPVASVEDIVIRTDSQPNPNPAMTMDAALAAAAYGKDVLLGVHGFNVSRADGISSLGHWWEWLEIGPNGLFIGVLWPGDSRWIPFIDYPIEGNEAVASGRLLAQYLGTELTAVNSVSFVSHSLGARVVLEAVRNLSPSFNVRTVTMMAGAIDDDCLNNEYHDAAVRIGKVSVLASRCDEVLKLAFPAGNVAAGIVTRGEPYWRGALGRYGPNPPNQPGGLSPSPILPDSWNFGHHSYINCSGSPGSPNESGRFSPLPLVVPSTEIPPPVQNANIPNWQQAWSAGFASTRFT